jgi:micrococcal nuclease
MKERPEKPSGRRAPENRPTAPPAPTAVVTRVVDGDTVEASYRGAIIDIRLIGIDTPETVHPIEPVECFGPAASRFTTASLSGDAVRLEFDVERRDQYGRRLAYVWDEGKLFNLLLVRRGLATVSTYPPNMRYVARFTAAQQQARAAGLGLWGRCSTPSSTTTDQQETTSPADGCNGYSPCLKSAVDYDCAGGSGDGPRYAEGPIKVTGPDPYDLDFDGDGVACEATS